MSKFRSQHHSNCVVGCRREHRSLHTLPTWWSSEWISFIYKAMSRLQLAPSCMCVIITSRQTASATRSSSQYYNTTASTLKVEDGAVPTVCDRSANCESVSTTMFWYYLQVSVVSILHCWLANELALWATGLLGAKEVRQLKLDSGQTF